MRPLHLTIEGLKSITDPQSIDFERVSKNGVFGIFGKTGSGKSTILDAIVLAIYGDVTEKIENSEFVNKGMDHASVKLLFSAAEGGEEKRYRVERRYKFGKDRKTLTPSAKLWLVTDEGEVLRAEGASQVTDLMKDEIIGLDKKDFLRCIALPQGDFAAFTKMGKAERLKVIGKLFDLEKYGADLSRKAREIDQQLRNEYSGLEGQKNALFEYSDENFKTIKEDYGKLEKEKERAEEEKKKSDERKKKAERIKEIYIKREKLSGEKEAMLEKAPEIERYRREIADFEDLLKIERIIEDTESGEKRLKKIRNDLQSLGETAADLKKQKEETEKDSLLIPEMEKSLDGLNIKESRIHDSEQLTKELEKKERELKNKSLEYRDLEAEKEKASRDMEKYAKEEEKYRKLAGESDCRDLLFKLSEKLSAVSVSGFAKEEIGFLGKLKTLVSSLTKEASADIVSLIDGRIKELSLKINERYVDLDDPVKELLDEITTKIKENEKYMTSAENALGKKNTAEAILKSISSQLESAEQSGKNLKKECEELKSRLEGVLQNMTYGQALSKVVFEKTSLSKKIAKIRSDKESIAEKISRNEINTASLNSEFKMTEKTLKRNGEELFSALEKKNISLEDAKAILADGALVASKKERVKSYDEALSFIEKSLLETEKTPEFGLYSPEETDKILKQCEETDSEYDDIVQNFVKIASVYQIGLKKNKEWCIINRNMSELDGKRRVMGKLLALLKDNMFMEFVAGEYLGEIADDAQTRLLELTGGIYGLTYENGVFCVTDNMRGGISRPVGGLSGGETFLVSLSLALALSAQISLNALKPIDFFFLDEGFGTLDDDLIETVTNSLEKLRKSDLTVGLITHVSELKNRIQSKIMVTGATALHGTIIED